MLKGARGLLQAVSTGKERNPSGFAAGLRQSSLMPEAVQHVFRLLELLHYFITPEKSLP